MNKAPWVLALVLAVPVFSGCIELPGFLFEDTAQPVPDDTGPAWAAVVAVPTAEPAHGLVFYLDERARALRLTAAGDSTTRDDNPTTPDDDPAEPAGASDPAPTGRLAALRHIDNGVLAHTDAKMAWLIEPDGERHRIPLNITDGPVLAPSTDARAPSGSAPSPSANARHPSHSAQDRPADAENAQATRSTRDAGALLFLDTTPQVGYHRLVVYGAPTFPHIDIEVEADSHTDWQHIDDTPLWPFPAQPATITVDRLFLTHLDGVADAGTSELPTGAAWVWGTVTGEAVEAGLRMELEPSEAEGRDDTPLLIDATHHFVLARPPSQMYTFSFLSNDVYDERRPHPETPSSGRLLWEAYGIGDVSAYVHVLIIESPSAPPTPRLVAVPEAALPDDELAPWDEARVLGTVPARGAWLVRVAPGEELRLAPEGTRTSSYRAFTEDAATLLWHERLGGHPDPYGRNGPPDEGTSSETDDETPRGTILHNLPARVLIINDGDAPLGLSIRTPDRASGAARMTLDQDMDVTHPVELETHVEHVTLNARSEGHTRRQHLVQTPLPLLAAEYSATPTATLTDLRLRISDTRGNGIGDAPGVDMVRPDRGSLVSGDAGMLQWDVVDTPTADTGGFRFILDATSGQGDVTLRLTTIAKSSLATAVQALDDRDG